MSLDASMVSCLVYSIMGSVIVSRSDSDAGAGAFSISTGSDETTA